MFYRYAVLPAVRLEQVPWESWYQGTGEFTLPEESLCSWWLWNHAEDFTFTICRVKLVWLHWGTSPHFRDAWGQDGWRRLTVQLLKLLIVYSWLLNNNSGRCVIVTIDPQYGSNTAAYWVLFRASIQVVQTCQQQPSDVEMLGFLDLTLWSLGCGLKEVIWTHTVRLSSSRISSSKRTGYFSKMLCWGSRLTCF